MTEHRSEPTVSVIIPCYNQAHFVDGAIVSVLTQTFQDFEIIVVDDGSTDETRLVVESIQDPRIRYLTRENGGLAAARNSGLAIARGEYVAFLDSDDQYLEHKLAVQVGALAAQPELGLVASGLQYVDESGSVIAEERPWLGRSAPDLESILLHGLAAVHAVLVRRSWLERIGGFDEQFRAAEDMDLWYRLALAGCPMAWVPAIVCQYWLHAQNMSRNINWHFGYLYTALEKLFVQAALPAAIHRRRTEIYAWIQLARAGRHYGAGQDYLGQAALASALRLDPSLATPGDRRLLDVMIAWRRSSWATDRERLLDRVLANLPVQSALPRDLRRRLRRHQTRSEFYAAYDDGDFARTRQLWPALALAEPAWLLNRGTWSILFRALGWLPRPADQVRPARVAAG